MIKWILTACVVCLIAAGAQAAVVQLDISGAFDYDAVGTSAEVATNVPTYGSYLYQSLGDHGVSGTNRAYTNDSSAGAVGRALPDDGVIGAYQISTAFDNGTDYLTKENNAIGIKTENTGTIFSSTITLTPGQQGKYSGFNMLFVSMRDADHSNYRSWIEATYTDSSTVIVVDTGVNGVVGGTGTFGLSNYQLTSDSTTFVNQAPGTGETIGVSNVINTTYGLSQSGTSQSIRTQVTSLWEFDQTIALDETKTLESLTINLQRSGVNRNQDIFVFAVNADLVPEPATMGLLSVGAIALLRRRRK